MPTHRIPVYSVRLVRESVAHYETTERPQPNSTQKAAALAAALLQGADREHFLVCFLDVKHRLIGVHTAHVGTLTASAVHPREVYKAAILSNAQQIIVCHNHPSGDTTPSPEDRAMTEKLRESGKILGIPLTDHIIVAFPVEQAGYRYYSFAEQGTL